MWYPFASSMGTLADFNDGEFWQWYEDLTNVHIEFIVPPVGGESNAFNMLFTEDDLPDILYSQPSVHSYRDGQDAAIDDGYIFDLSDHKEWVPNYMSWVNHIENADKNVYTDSGRMYGMWGFSYTMENGYPDQGIAIRKDFLDKTGLEIPATYDEWETVLTAFRDELGIEAPFYTGKYGIDNGEFMAGYGVSPDFYQVNNVVKYGPMEDGFKDYITMLNDWFSKGLLDPDFASRQSSGISADSDMMLNDKIGALIDWGTRMTDAYLTRGATNEDFYLTAVPQPKLSEDSADPAWNGIASSYQHIYPHCVLISQNCEYPEVAARWIDGFFAENIFWNANYGIDSEEGTVWYKAEDGHRIGNYDFRYANPDGIDSATVVVKYWVKNPPVRVEAAQIEQMPEDRAESYSVWSRYPASNYLSPFKTMTTEETDEYVSLYPDIELYMRESIVRFIRGDLPMSEYDNFRETLKKMGILRCIEIQQAALNRYNER